MSITVIPPDKEKYIDLLNAYAYQNINLNLCKHYLHSLVQSDLTPIELKRNIKEFLKTIEE
jgi:hypothetical protein